jgi:hypothetical protein
MDITRIVTTLTSHYVVFAYCIGLLRAARQNLRPRDRGGQQEDLQLPLLRLSRPPLRHPQAAHPPEPSRGGSRVASPEVCRRPTA